METEQTKFDPLVQEFIALIEGMKKEASLKATDALGEIGETTMNEVMVRVRAVNFPLETTPEEMIGNHVMYIPGLTERLLDGLQVQLKTILPSSNITADVVHSLHTTYLFGRQEWDSRLNNWIAQQSKNCHSGLDPESSTRFPLSRE